MDNLNTCDLTRPRTERTGAFRVRRVPVWVWRSLMGVLSGHERWAFNTHPITDVEYHRDIAYTGDNDAAHRLDVITPTRSADSARGDGSPLPVYVYFHGGGWTSGDKAALTKYCASQSVGGMVVVNANYRKARRADMGQILQDASNVLAWVADNIASFGGDPHSLVLGGDSAGGQIAALITASSFSPELAEHHAIAAVPDRVSLKGLVQHCSVVDFSLLFDRESVLSLDFIRMLVPRYRRLAGASGSREQKLAWLRREARFLSPIEWLRPGFPPVFVSTSERDYFFRANLRFLSRLSALGIAVETLIYDHTVRNAVHTWQQNARRAESQEVYRRLHRFVAMVTGSGATVGGAR